MPEFAYENISPGLQHPVLDSQRIFRAVLLTMSRPGTVTVLGNWPAPPSPLKPAAASVCLALADLDTPLWLESTIHSDIQTYLRFHCGCPLTQKQEDASFAVVMDGNDLPDLKKFEAGTEEYPDRSATVIIQVRELNVGRGVTLTGPGIKDSTKLTVDGLDSGFWREFKKNSERFPLGYDVILASDTEIASLPRTVRVEV